ncbi:MAG TPA: ATP-binding protein [Pyrinomonadaceae bacterium]|jgi:signal transduction histidine kinase/HAMP domain-containing protein
MKHGTNSRRPLDVRTKLLVMLIVLSLPMLIISLFQLESYQKNLTEQATTIARIKAVAAEGALDAWLENRPAAVAQGAALAPTAASELYARLRQHASPNADAALLVFDARGQLVPEPSAPNISHVPLHAAADVHQERWSDNVERLTSERRSTRYGWSVAVGVPLAEHTPAGRGFLALTAAWALGLMASSFLSIWAVGRFTTPLRRLAASASTLGQGQLHERFEVETDDEVGTLAAGFNVMAASLETKFNELRTQGAFIEEVLDSLPLGVAVLDSGLILRKANSTFARIVGRDPASLNGRGVYEAAAGLAVLSEVVEDVRRTRRAFVNYGLPLELVSRTTTGDARNDREEGAKYWDVILWPMSERTEERGDLLLILSEVSKRVRAEKLATAAFAAEKSRAAELESVINQMDEGVIIVDARGRYRVNPAAARIIGRKPGEFRDGVDALIADMALRDADGRLLPAEETPLGRALARGEHVSGEHVQIVRGAAAEEGVLAVSATPLVGEGGGREGVVAVFRDITPEVRQYKELMGAYGRLREHDRLKSAFVANVSHELRTPLNVIIGLCQLLERDRRQPLAPLQSEAVERMGRNARSLLELVNDLLDYSRLEAGRSALQLESVDVASVTQDVLKGFAAEVEEKRVRLEAEVSPALGPVNTDRHKLSQVLTNLVSNAVKFTATGTIRVVAAPLDETHWFLDVSDTGIGISREALSFIFDEFRQVDDRLTRPYSGVGLGLAITRKIVELLEGEITVESRPNEGSHFRIVWPLNAQPRTGTGSLIKDAATNAAASGKERPAAGDLRLERQNLRTRTG